VLDIGAGAGRYALAAQQLGCEVVALDVSEGVLDVCCARGVSETYLGTVAERAPANPPQFDSFLLLGNNLDSPPPSPVS
jgi:ubiquinone/menaquinone biosynthesis C-methylase UbiE